MFPITKRSRWGTRKKVLGIYTLSVCYIIGSHTKLAEKNNKWKREKESILIVLQHQRTTLSTWNLVSSKKIKKIIVTTVTNGKLRRRTTLTIERSNGSICIKEKDSIHC